MPWGLLDLICLSKLKKSSPRKIYKKKGNSSLGAILKIKKYYLAELKIKNKVYYDTNMTYEFFFLQNKVLFFMERFYI